MKRLLAIFFVVLAFSAGARAEEKKISEEDVKKLVLNQIVKIKASEDFLKKQTDRVMKGDVPPDLGGVPAVQTIIRHFTDLGMENVELMDDFQQEFSAAFGASGGSCVGTRPIKDLWCHKCSRKIKIFGVTICIEEMFESAIYYRYPTQMVELAYNAYQTGFTASEIIKLSQLIRDNDFAQLVSLLDLKNANLKTLVQSMPKKILDEMQIKYECMMAQAAHAGVSVAMSSVTGGSTAQVQNQVIAALTACLSRMTMQKDVLSTLTQLPTNYRGGIADSHRSTGHEYTYTQTPAYMFRMLYENVFKKLPPFRIGLFFKVGLGSLQPGNMGIVLQPFLKHINLPPYAPGIRPLNIANIGKGGMTATALTGGDGQLMNEEGVFPDGVLPAVVTNKSPAAVPNLGGIAEAVPGIGDIPGIGGNVSIPGIGGIGGGIGNGLGGIINTPPRAAQLDPFFLDGQHAHKMIPSIGGLALSLFPASQYSMFSLLAAPLAPFASSFMANVKDMSLCDIAMRSTPAGAQIASLTHISDMTPGIKQTFRYLKLLNPIMGGKAEGFFKGQINSMFGSANPPCFAHGLGPSGAPVTKTRSSSVASTVVKAVIDSRFIPFATMMYNPRTGKVGPSTYYEKKYNRPGQPLPRFVNEFTDKIGLKHSLHLKKNPRPAAMKAELPKTCEDPEVPEDAMAEFAKSPAPLDGSRIITEWTAFQMCNSGEKPVNDLVANSNPMLKIGWIILRALGAKNFWVERYL